MLSSTGLLLLSAASTAFGLPTADLLEERAVCKGSTFKKLPAAEWVKSANPGWNLGNTLDAEPTEGSWNNPPVVASTFDKVKSSGFKAVRIPVTWTDHFVTGSPTWTVNSTWLQRVSDVVDMTLSRGLYTIVNVHHDASDWADLTAANANYTAIEEQFYALWYQIGTKLACKSSLLAFEPINEPTATTPSQIAELLKLEDLFVQALDASGGYNQDRVLTLVGPSEDSVQTSQYFTPPKNITNPWAIQFHYYSPYDFIFGAWGKTIWGSDADKTALEADFHNIRGNFTDVPLLIGEWSGSQTYTETAARWKYTDFLAKTAVKYNISTFMWDNGIDDLDRNAGVWRDQTVIDLLMSATKGKPNALPDSQEDGTALSQYSYAYIYHKVGTPVVDQTNTYLLNGNTFSSIRAPNGNSLRSGGVDYTATGPNITYKASLISKYISPTSAPGSKANFTVHFSKGAPVTANLVQWDVATLGGNNQSASAAAATGTDLAIPVTWKGVNRIAAVKATLADGTCLVDTWTVYLPALQQCRMTYSSQWSWDDSHVIITAAAVQAVVSAKQTATFTVEFYPRTPGNSANFTLTV